MFMLFSALFDFEFEPKIYPFDFQVCDVQMTLYKRQLATVV